MNMMGLKSLQKQVGRDRKRVEKAFQVGGK